MLPEILKDMSFPMKRELFLSKLFYVSPPMWERKTDQTNGRTFFQYTSGGFAISLSSYADSGKSYFTITVFNKEYRAEVIINKQADGANYTRVEELMQKLINQKSPEVKKAETEMSNWLTHRGGGCTAII